MPPYTGLTLLPVLPKNEPNAGRVIINDNFSKIQTVLQNLQLEAASANTIVSAGTNIDVVFLGFSGGATPIYQVSTLSDVLFNSVSASTFYSGSVNLGDIIASSTTWDFSGSNIYNKNSGNVGVGTADPLYKFHSIGDFYNFYTYSNVENTIENSSTNDIFLQSSFPLGGSFSNLNISWSNSTLTNFNGSSQSDIDSFANLLRLRVNDGLRNLDFSIGLSNFQFSNDVDTLMTVEDDGRVGVGTNLSPQHRFHVSGDTLMANNSYSIFNVDSLPFSSSLSGAGVYYTDGIVDTGVFTADLTGLGATPSSIMFNQDISGDNVKSVEVNNNEALVQYKDLAVSSVKNAIVVDSLGVHAYGKTAYSADTNMSWSDSGGTVLMELKNGGLALENSPIKFVTADLNNILGYSNLSGITSPQVIDYATAQSYSSSGLFSPGAYYKITGVDTALYGGTDIILQAVSSSNLSDRGYGFFYNPKYDKNINGFGIWTNWNELDLTNEVGNLIPGESIKSDNDATGILAIGGPVSYFVRTGGVWSAATAITGFTSQATADISSSQLITYNPGDSVIWGGKHWINQTGSIGSSTDVLNLDLTNWSAVTFNEADYNLVVDEIAFDFDNNRIIERVEVDSNSKVITTNNNVLSWSGLGFTYPNPIQVFQWGNAYSFAYQRGIGNQHIDCGYNENINFNGAKQVDFRFKPGSYQINVLISWNFSYLQHQSGFDFGIEAYQAGIKIGASAYQLDFNFGDYAYQENIVLSQNAYQELFNFEQTAYQSNVNFMFGSKQSKVDLSFSLQTDFTLDVSVEQSNIVLNNVSWNRSSALVSANEIGLNWIGNPVKITDGTQADGYVLTSDANGLASWQPIASLTISSTTTNNNVETVLDTVNTIPDNDNSFLVSYVSAYLDNTDYGFWKRTIAVNKYSGTVSLVRENSDFDQFSSGLTSYSVVYSGNAGDIEIRVVGENSKTYNWKSRWELI